MHTENPEKLPTSEIAVYFGAPIPITAKHTTKVLTAHLPYKIEKECFAFKSEKE